MGRFLACLTGLVLGACAVTLAPSVPPSLTPSPSEGLAPNREAATPTASAVVETAADLLECDGEPSDMGGRADEFGPSGGGDNPRDAFEAFLADPLFVIPRSGYVELGSVGDRTVYAFERDGSVKVVVVVSPRFGELVRARYTVEEVRACEQAEFGQADFGPSRRVWTHSETGDIVTDIAGPSHCEWQSGRMLHVVDGDVVRQYLRDPEGVFAFARLLDTYAEGLELPDDATDSGYRSPEGLELWFTRSDRAAYIVTSDGVERWPRAEEPIGCM